MGGATPAEPPGFLGDGDVPSAGGPHDPRGWSSIPDVVSEGVTLYEMYREGGDPTLKTYLTYQTDPDGNVNGIDVTIKNSGASSAQLETITLTETGLPSFTTCTLNKTCYFEPDDVVNIDPGQNTSIKICQNCLANNKTIFNSFSSLFYINKNSQIEVKVTIAMLWSADGHKTTYSKVPFVYTIPWR